VSALSASPTRKYSASIKGQTRRLPKWTKELTDYLKTKIKNVMEITGRLVADATVRTTKKTKR